MMTYSLSQEIIDKVLSHYNSRGRVQAIKLLLELVAPVMYLGLGESKKLTDAIIYCDQHPDDEGSCNEAVFTYRDITYRSYTIHV